jgi:hypothetical protein
MSCNKALVLSGLIGVSIVTALRDVVNARGQAAGDEFGDEFQ